MSTVAVFLDALDESTTSAERELLALAAGLGEVVVITGAGAQRAADALDFAAVTTVYSADRELSAPDPALVDLLEEGVRESGADTVLAAATPDATDALARLAVRLDAGIITDAIDIDAEGQARKSVLAGAYTTVARIEGHPRLYTVRPNSVDADTVSSALGESGRPEGVTLPVPAATEGSGIVVEQRSPLEGSDRPSLNEARIVVAGGRGVDGDFSVLEELADELGAAIGASRAATDAGWIDHAAQVGQTGVTVSPQLYISAGISGAIQQRAGMQTAQTIVAINKDEDAPVFEIADFGVVGDLFDVVPQMVEALRQRKSS